MACWARAKFSTENSEGKKNDREKKESEIKEP